MAAALAQRQRRIAPAVEEQQRLLAPVEGGEDLARQLRRDPLALLGRLLAHVDGRNLRHCRLGEARGQQHVLVAAGIGVVAAFDARCRRRQDHPCLGELGPDHGHVAGVVVHPVGLLERPVMLFVEHDQPEFAERQEQRRAGAEHDADIAVEHCPPGARPHWWRHVGVPLARLRAEAPGEAGDETGGQGDLGEENEGLPAGANRVGDGLEKHLGLARPRDAIEQRHAELVRVKATNFCQCPGLVIGEGRHRRIRIGHECDRRRQGLDSLDRPCPLQPVDHGGRNPGSGGDGGLGPRLPVHQHVEHLRPRRGELVGVGAGAAVGGDGPLGLQRLGGAQYRAEHQARWRERVAADPLDRLQQFFGERRRVVDLGDVLEPVVGEIVLRQPPHHTQRQPADQRHSDDRAARHRHAIGHPVRVRPLDRHAHHDRHDAGEGFAGQLFGIIQHEYPLCSRVRWRLQGQSAT